jgi:hypothetical protein
MTASYLTRPRATVQSQWVHRRTSTDELSLSSGDETDPNVVEGDRTLESWEAQLEVLSVLSVMDESYGRTAAEVEEIETRGMAYLVLFCAKQGYIAVSKARQTIDSMIEAGWYCAPDLYTKLVRKLESFKQN